MGQYEGGRGSKMAKNCRRLLWTALKENQHNQWNFSNFENWGNGIHAKLAQKIVEGL